MARQPAPQRGGAPSVQYSRAFDNIVQDSDDIVGLLAYALYKEAVREEVTQGAQANPHTRNPPSSVVKIYREAAEQRLAAVVNGGIAQATPDIEAAAIGNVVKASETAISSKLDSVTLHLESHVTRRTGFLSAFLTNIFAWVVTLAVTIIILALANRDGLEDMAVKSANQMIDNSAGQSKQENTK